MSVIAEWLTRICPELNEALHESNHFRRIAFAFADKTSTEEMLSLVVKECMLTLNADGGCLYLLSESEHFQLHAEINCGDFLRKSLSKIPARNFPLVEPHLIYQTREEFARSTPQLSTDLSVLDWKSLAVAPLVVNKNVTGFMVFFYHQQANREVVIRPYASTVIQFCAQALERVRLTENEHAAREKAESANRAKSEYLANISHEIRTPIGVVQGFTDLLNESQGLNESQKHWVSVIQRNTQQLTALIGEVLDISKIEAEKIEVKKSDFCLPELLEDVRTSAHFKAQAKDIQLIFQTENLPNTVRTDSVRLRQILVNLVGNAIKFTEIGSVTVHAGFDIANSCLKFQVTDTGVGIPEDLHAQIFEPFRQTELGALQQFGGTGLGLTISKRLALALGGDVRLERSRPGEGSSFIFILPCEVAPQLASSTMTAPFLSEANLGLRGMKILIVDDSIDSQDLLRSLLSFEGAQVDIADSGISGVKMAMSRNYHVVLMDIQMPGLNGHEAVAWLRSHGYDRPVAAVTANALSADKQNALTEGFDDYLTKPIDRKALVDCLQRLAFS